MAPEQAGGRSRATTTAADVYGLGALLYAVCTGRPPFEGACREDVLVQVQYSEPRPPRHFRPDLPRDLETICLKCLHKDRARRYGSAEQLADDLHRFLHGQPIQARPVGVLERAGKWARRHRLTAALLSLCALLMLALILGLSWHAVRLQEVLDAVRQERDRAVRSEGAARDLAYALDVHQVHQLCAHGDPFALPAVLDRYLPGEDGIDRRGFEWWYLQRQRQQPHPPLSAHSGQPHFLGCTSDDQYLITAQGWGEKILKVWRIGELDGRSSPRPCWQLPRMNPVGYPNRNAALSPDGSLLAVIDDQARVLLYRTATWECLPPLPQHGSLFSLSFSADGLNLYGCGDAPIHRWHVHSRQLATAPAGSGGQSCLLPSPDNQILLGIERDRGLSLWDAQTLRFLRRELPGQTVLALGASRSGKAVGLVSNGSNGQRISLWDTRHRTLRSFPPTEPPVHLVSLAISDDERCLAAGANDGSLQVWDLKDRQLRRTLRWQGFGLIQVAFAPDGELFAAADDGFVYRLDPKVFPLFENVRPAIEAGNALAFSPDDKRLAIADRRGCVHLVESQGSRILRTLGPTTRTIAELAFRPDGRTLAIVGEDGLELWDTGTGRQLPCRLEGAEAVAGAAFTRDGSSLLLRTQGGNLVLWSPERDREQDCLAAEAVVGPVVSAEGRSVAAGCRDRRVRVWPLRDGRLGREATVTEPLDGPPTCLALSPNGRTLLAGKPTGPTLAVWEMDGKGGLNAADPLALQVPARAAHLEFAPDGRRAFCRMQDGLAFLLDVPLRMAHHGVGGVGERWCRHGTLSPDGLRLAAISHSGEVAVWDTASWQIPSRPHGALGPVRVLAFTPDGRQLLASSTLPGGRSARTEWKIGRYDRWMFTSIADGLRTWDSGGTEGSMDLPTQSIVGWTTLFAFSPDTRLVAASSTDGSIWLWDRHEQKLSGRHFLDPKEEMQALGQELANPGVALRFSLSERVTALAFSPDNRLLAVLRRDGALTLREVSTWKECAALPPANRRFVAIAPDGRRLATNDGGRVQLFDVPTLSPAPGPDRTTGPVLCGCFSADGSRLAVGTEDRTVQLWDLRTGELRELHGHRERVSAVAFAPDGRTLASGSGDRSVRLWSVAAGQEVATLEGHAGKVLALVFSPSGRLLASGGEVSSGNGEVLFWRADENSALIPCVKAGQPTR